MNFKYTTEELKKLAEGLADKTEAPFSILLTGDLGAGKTTFAKLFIGPLLIDKTQKVTSPTFNIIQIYETKKGPIWHADLYRLKNKEELFELGLIEAMSDSICLIEWPLLLRDHIEIPKSTEIHL
ncbi:MAG: tRNA (adenosine(37)-N6)-threonylcarbamoyltransferase complex ATPase subunit type 1 TsaE [Holosporales bacterium]|jgi:tRNA threonylcarbamoyl adenosine modification protein YjeE|nr:tRNA (adenosine(37)-N6)-threonylcarbamoyltransferase complex ATPase subunit type 1 TsaE [Holosporales bacterium]